MSCRSGRALPELDDDSGQVEFELPLKRADIADFLGLTIETVSRTFTILRKSRTIALDTPQTVLVLDLDALIDASQADT